jgi:hypothetical protein
MLVDISGEQGRQYLAQIEVAGGRAAFRAIDVTLITGRRPSDV